MHVKYTFYNELNIGYIELWACAINHQTSANTLLSWLRLAFRPLPCPTALLTNPVAGEIRVYCQPTRTLLWQWAHWFLKLLLTWWRLVPLPEDDHPRPTLREALSATDVLRWYCTEIQGIRTGVCWKDVACWECKSQWWCSMQCLGENHWLLQIGVHFSAIYFFWSRLLFLVSGTGFISLTSFQSTVHIVYNEFGTEVRYKQVRL